MDFILDLFEERPIWMLVVLLAIICLIISKANKKAPQQNNNKTTYIGGTGTKVVNGENSDIGLVDKTEVEYGYYRKQPDNQLVIKRNEEQQRIFEQYFVVKNIKTTTCDSSLKRKAKLIKTISKVLCWPGIIATIVGLFPDQKTFLVIGLMALAATIICKIAGNKILKNFNDSIKVTIAPKKLMTDAEYEALVAKKIESMDIAQLGLDRLGLDPDQVKEIRPIVLMDKVITSSSLTVENNNSVHSSTQHVTYLYFTDEQLFVYKVQFDMCCNMQDEWASEFFYKDICDISSKTSRVLLSTDNFKFEYSTVSFNIIASNSQIGFELDGNNENIGSILAMKQKIREKKAQ